MKNKTESTISSCPDLLNFEELCNILKISKTTGYKLLKRNEIDYIKVGRKYMIPKAFILKYLKINDNI